MRRDGSNMTLVVNLYGGPGTGKSTTAAGLFSALKLAGYNAELVTEFAKDLVWEKHYAAFDDQIWITANQLRRIKRLLGQVDVIVTDSPIMLGLYYDDMKTPGLAGLIVQQHHEMKTLDVMLRRVKAYNPKGRTQTEAEARAVDDGIQKMLYQVGVEMPTVDADGNAVQTLLKMVTERL